MASSLEGSHVSLHPVANRDGTSSATYVSVQVPSQSPTHQTHNQDESHSHIRAQSYPQFHPTHVQQSHSYSSTSQAQASLSPTSIPPPLSLSTASNNEWGLVHSDIDQYPPLDEQLVQRSSSYYHSSNPSPTSPRYHQQQQLPSIRAISASQFATIHRQHAECDVPHSVVFPFLHGVDGDNVAQNIFFSAPINGQPSPNYRGLTIVRADMPAPGHRIFTPNHRKRASSSASRLNGNQMSMSGMPGVVGNGGGGRNRADSLATTASSTYSNASDEDWAYQHGSNPTPPLLRRGEDGNQVRGSGSTTSISSSLDSYSHQSSNSLFSFNSHSDESKTSIYTSEGGGSKGGNHLNNMARRRKHRSSPVYDPQPKHSILNSTIFPAEVLNPPSSNSGNDSNDLAIDQEGATFVQVRQANGVSLRNFKIQCTKYATISDIVVYCPAGLHEGAIELADWFRQAQQNWWEERCDRGLGGLRYNVFVVTDTFEDFEQHYPELIAVDASGFSRNRVDFIEREREEMQRLTTASEIDENVWLGCSADVPFTPSANDQDDSLTSLETSLPEESNPNGFSVCITAFEGAEMPDLRKLNHASHYMDAVEATAVFELNSQAALRDLEEDEEFSDEEIDGPSLGPSGWSPSLGGRSKMAGSGGSSSSSSRGAPNFTNSKTAASANGTPTHIVPAADNVLHMECGSSSSSYEGNIALDSFVEEIITLCSWIKKQACPPKMTASTNTTSSGQSGSGNSFMGALRGVGYHRSSSATSLGSQYSQQQQARSNSSPLASSTSNPQNPLPRRTLIHCGDGYTETSILALSYLMFSRKLSLPEAYLDLQNRANRSFFVYARDLPLLKKIEARFSAERKASEKVQQRREKEQRASNSSSSSSIAVGAEREPGSGNTESLGRSRGKHGFGRASSVSRRGSSSSMGSRHGSSSSDAHPVVEQTFWARGLGAVSGLVSAAQGGKEKDSKKGHGNNNLSPSSASNTPGQGGSPSRTNTPTPKGSPTSQRTVPAPISPPVDHSWFYDSRFEGSFPSRILPFLYLGNLNHALNANMLHALGITHVVSVGETALNPPSDAWTTTVKLPKASHGSDKSQGLPPVAGAHNSLWHEEKAGRISVLDLKNVSDDGIDPLRSAMTQAVEYIEQARRSGGKALVHCRVGVSRSSTIVLAYVMAHLDLGLVESYLLVRSRRLNILIQPHLLFFWELRGWENYLKLEKKKKTDSLTRGSIRSYKTSFSRQGSSSDEGDYEMRDGTLDVSLGSLSISSGETPPCSPTLFKGNKASKKGQQHKNLQPISLDNDASTSMFGSSPTTPSKAAFSLTDEPESEDLDVDIGAGAGSIYGFEVPDCLARPFGTGSVANLPIESVRLTWGFMANQIAELNQRYFV